MNPKDLVVGDIFKVAEACDPEELIATHEVLEIEKAQPQFFTVIRAKIEEPGKEPSIHRVILPPWIELVKLNKE